MYSLVSKHVNFLNTPKMDNILHFGIHTNLAYLITQLTVDYIDMNQIKLNPFVLMQLDEQQSVAGSHPFKTKVQQ